MFLPRKLQKRAHSKGTTSTASPAPTAAETTEESHGTSPDCSSINADTTSTSYCEDGDQTQRSSSQITSTSSTSAPQATATTSTEVAKLERLVEFLFVRLSPPYLVLAAREERKQSGNGPCSDLVSTITASVPSGNSDSTDKSPESTTQQGSRIHLARMLSSIPGLATRCKSISLLSEAIEAMQEGAAVGWFTLHKDTFQLEWSTKYIKIVQQLHTAATKIVAEDRLSAALAPHLVYIESIPPRFRSRSQAASYIGTLLKEAAVLAVLEPASVDRQLMAGKSRPPVSRLEEKWISGRGFFLLDSPTQVEELCSKYRWNLAERMPASQSANGTEKTEPIRCLSWPKWVEMKKLYLEQQQRSRQRPPSPEQDDIAEDSNGKRKHISPPNSERLDTEEDEADSNANWYRGTILLLPLMPSLPSGSSLNLPSYSESNLTPALFNRHLKPQLEKQVPESISYINILPSHPANESKTVAAIRTSHPKYATQLLSRFPELQRMDQAGEEQYWAELPAKVRTAAQNRILSLDRKLNPP